MRQGRSLLIAVPLLAGVLALGGCATTSTDVVSADDVCSHYRQPIADVQKAGLKTDDILMSLGAGAVAGVLTGLITGKPAAGAAAAAGAVALTAGAKYLQAKQKQSQDRKTLAMSIYQDETRDGQAFAPIPIAVTQLRTCRHGQFQELLTEARRGQLPKDQARVQFDTLLRQRARDDQIVAQALGTADERVSLYQDALQRSQNDQLYAAIDAQSRQSSLAASGGRPPLRGVVQQVRRAENAEKRRTDMTVDQLHVLLG